MSYQENKEEVDMDNPAYAQQDPHLRISEEEDQAGIPPSFRNKTPFRPPLFDTLLNNIRAITKKVEHIKGFKFEVSGALSHNFHLTHTWAIPHGGSAQAAGGGRGQNPNKQPAAPLYTLSAQFLGGQIRTPYDQPAYIMTGRLDSQGKLEAAIIKKLNEMFSLRFSAYFMNSDPNNSQMHVDLDITGDDYVHTVKWGSGLISVNMMQTIGQRMVLGFEMMNLTERKSTMMSYAAKYALNRRQTFYGQYIGPADQLILAYNHKLLERASLVSELNYAVSSGETSAVLGFRQRFATSEVIATMTSRGKMSTILSMSGMAYQLKLCAIADYVKDSYKFGYGIAMGQVG